METKNSELITDLNEINYYHIKAEEEKPPPPPPPPPPERRDIPLSPSEPKIKNFPDKDRIPPPPPPPNNDK
jgi:hypothetical protein